MADNQHLDQQVPATLRAIMRYRTLTDKALAERTGYTAQQIKFRRTGRSRFTFQDLDAFAAALEVEPHVFLLSPPLAVKAVIEHDQGDDDPSVKTGNRRRHPTARPVAAPFAHVA